MNRALWIVQTLLALEFVFSGSSKFAMSVEDMTKQMPVALSGSFLHFIGVCEVLGGIGLILPALLHIKPGLTSLAASGLVVIMIGATTITLMGGMVATALLPLATGLLAAFVAYGRWRLAPIS
ncbi:MAG TPA: DoxX family protein [Bryobacteraceae bacterium]|nr:DoxX family protein [Bryobacteraceae bacterium]